MQMGASLSCWALFTHTIGPNGLPRVVWPGCRAYSIQRHHGPERLRLCGAVLVPLGGAPEVQASFPSPSTVPCTRLGALGHPILSISPCTHTLVPAAAAAKGKAISSDPVPRVRVVHREGRGGTHSSWPAVGLLGPCLAVGARVPWDLESLHCQGTP